MAGTVNSFREQHRGKAPESSKGFSPPPVPDVMQKHEGHMGHSLVDTYLFPAALPTKWQTLHTHIHTHTECTHTLAGCRTSSRCCKWGLCSMCLSAQSKATSVTSTPTILQPYTAAPSKQYMRLVPHPMSSPSINPTRVPGNKDEVQSGMGWK
eukprot:1158903-Pelagomonas_calceolata.AAC.12